jgi:hypothetical protein
MQGMSHDQLLVQEVIHRAHVLICRAEGLSAEESIRALADRAAQAGMSLHMAAMGVLGRSAVGQDPSPPPSWWHGTRSPLDRSTSPPWGEAALNSVGDHDLITAPATGPEPGDVRPRRRA